MSPSQATIAYTHFIEFPFCIRCEYYNVLDSISYRRKVNRMCGENEKEILSLLEFYALCAVPAVEASDGCVPRQSGKANSRG